MYLPRSAAKSYTIPGGSDVRLYPSSPNGDQTIAAVICDGVYPERGYSVNDVCTETIYVTDGSYTLEVDGKTVTLTPGDAFIITPGTKYRLSGRGASLVFITPAWERNTNRIVDAA